MAMCWNQMKLEEARTIVGRTHLWDKHTYWELVDKLMMILIADAVAPRAHTGRRPVVVPGPETAAGRRQGHQESRIHIQHQGEWSDPTN